jgi:glycogen debranching enzyme
MTTVRVAHPTEILHGHGAALACDRQGRIVADEQHGLFVADTRVLSTYRLSIGGRSWQALGRQRVGYGSATWQFQNPKLREASGEIREGTLHLEIRRRVAAALHDDLVIRAFPEDPIRTTFVMQLDADFADIFEVKARSVPARPLVGRATEDHAIELTYQRGSFRRRCRIRFESRTPPRFAGSLVAFDLDLRHDTEWRCCIDVIPEIDGDMVAFVGDPHEPERLPVEPPTTRAAGPPELVRALDRSGSDLASLALPLDRGDPLVAAGAPWFLTLFGRDPLVTGLMTGLLGRWVTDGALRAVGDLQASERDDPRDAEPGKLPHELRRGELAHLGAIPHTPYYGTHDAPALYCLALWNAWRWTGDDGLLDRHLETARRALRWCDELGDRDGDGLQEYATRSDRGYDNQGWKDAGDAIVNEDGSQARPPIATVELQGYLFAARLAMAELLEWTGGTGEGERLRSEAGALRDLVEERFWIEELGSYALALDGDKRQVRSVASNAGHLLWCGLPDADRARRVTARLLEPDMSSGWGLRTLSSAHPAYNPLSYQLGSVWPHDTALAAAGMARYGFRDEAWRLARALLDAAGAFEDDRLPELFCGFDRSEDLPVPYREANVPQAWAAAAPPLIVQTILGLVPDAPRGGCWLSPRLPDEIPRLDVGGIHLGAAVLDLRLRRDGADTDVRWASSSTLALRRGAPGAPLWGAPPQPASNRSA